MQQQLIAHIIVAAAIYANTAVGVGLTSRLRAPIDFSQAAVIVVAAYLVHPASVALQLPIWLLPLLGAGLGGVVAIVLEWSVTPLIRKPGAPLDSRLLGTFALYILIENLIAMLAGDRVLTYWPRSMETVFVLRGISVSTSEVIVLAYSLSLLLIALAIDRSRWGLMARAVASDPRLAGTRGINVSSITRFNAALSGMHLGLAGTLSGFRGNLVPTMGLPLFLVGALCVAASNGQSLRAIIAAALLFASAQHLAGWWFGWHWQASMTAVVLCVALAIRSVPDIARRM